MIIIIGKVNDVKKIKITFLQKPLFIVEFGLPSALRSRILPGVFLGKSILKICSKFAGEHTCLSVISIKLSVFL